MVSEGSFSEASTRRFFIEESRRRVLALLDELRWFTERYRRRPPAWTYERIAALAGQVGADDATTGALSDSIDEVEIEIRRALLEMAALLDIDTPIPFTVTQEPIPAPKPLRPFLTVLRGGRA